MTTVLLSHLGTLEEEGEKRRWVTGLRMLQRVPACFYRGRGRRSACSVKGPGFLLLLVGESRGRGGTRAHSSNVAGGTKTARISLLTYRKEGGLYHVAWNLPPIWRGEKRKREREKGVFPSSRPSKGPSGSLEKRKLTAVEIIFKA